jgi:predicted CoA-binding protein
VLGERAYPSLKDVPGQVDIVNIFRRPARVPEVVEEAIGKGGVRCVWMQEGVVSPEGKAKAEAAQIPVVMDRCILKELARLLR